MSSPPIQRTRRRFLVTAGIASAFGLSPAQATEPLRAIATFSILADMTREIGGERVRVDALVGPDSDAHAYQPTPADARRLAQAHLVVTNGMGFEGWMDRLVTAAGYRGEVVVATRGIRVIREPRKGHSTVHHHRDADPHAWQDLGNAAQYVSNIEAALARADPAGAHVYRANAAAYRARLDALDAEIRAALDRLPQERRRIVTSHDAFGYFAHAYNLQFLAPVGLSTDSDPTAADVAKLIRQIKKERIPAVFIENISDPRLLERVRAETGARIGGTLYSDALSAPGGPAATYLDLMRHNLRTLAEALAP